MADMLITFIDLFLHLDRYLGDILQYFGVWTYVLLFLIIFCETGLVVTPILPGDSLLFGLGAFAANPILKGPLEVECALLTLAIAAIAGDTVNYSIGNFVGPRVFHDGKYRFLKREYLERTHPFYEKHGGKTIVIARFIPIVRTFAPFVAGIGAMSYRGSSPTTSSAASPGSRPSSSGGIFSGISRSSRTTSPSSSSRSSSSPSCPG